MERKYNFEVFMWAIVHPDTGYFYSDFSYNGPTWTKDPKEIHLFTNRHSAQSFIEDMNHCQYKGFEMVTPVELEFILRNTQHD